MNSLLSGILDKLGLTTYRSHLILITGLMVATIVYIYTPYMPWGEKFVEMNDSRLLLKFNSDTESCDIFFRYPVNAVNYVITPINTIEAGEVRKGVSVDLNKFTNHIRFTPQAVLKDIGSTRISGFTIDLTIADQHPPAEIYMVRLNDIEKSIDDFHKNYVYTASSVLIETKSIRSDLSRALVKYNNKVSNYILVFLTSGAAVLLVYLLRMLVIVYMYPSKLFEKRILRINSIGNEKGLDEIEAAKHKCGNNFTKLNSYCRFFQTIGPAVGFMLTVSSLIVALNPATLSNYDLTIFFDSIQIAMISTFIGLFIRVEAILLQSANKSMLIRSDSVFEVIEHEYVAAEPGEDS